MKSIVTAVKLAGIVFVAFGLGALVMLALSIYRPAHAGSPATSFEIKTGEGPRTIASALAKQHLLDDERPFYIYVLASGKKNRFFPGTYDLPANASIKTIVKILTDGKLKRLTVRVVEGWRIKDIAAEVGKKTKISAEQFLAAAPAETYEGYLFPDTYEFSEQTSAAQMVKTMRENFDKRTASLGSVPTKEQVTIASIVEREAKHDADRAQIAGLYYNRLSIHMALEADPTIQYAKGSWTPITLADYHSVDSPYNTYLHPGIPPTPISNPGLKSLEAAVHPAEHDYIYFFNISDGSTIFSKTLAEHAANKQKYLK